MVGLYDQLDTTERQLTLELFADDLVHGCDSIEELSERLGKPRIENGYGGHGEQKIQAIITIADSGNNKLYQVKK